MPACLIRLPASTSVKSSNSGVWGDMREGHICTASAACRRAGELQSPPRELACLGGASSDGRKSATSYGQLTVLQLKYPGLKLLMLQRQ